MRTQRAGATEYFDSFVIYKIPAPKSLLFHFRKQSVQKKSFKIFLGIAEKRGHLDKGANCQHLNLHIAEMKQNNRKHKNKSEGETEHVGQVEKGTL